MDNRMSGTPVDSGYTLTPIDDLLASHKRLAEIMARVVTLPEQLFVDKNNGLIRAQTWNECLYACIAAIKAAGVTVEGE